MEEALDISLNLIKGFESCKLQAYQVKKSDGELDKWTCGWGQTGPDVNEGTVWTQGQADARFSETVYSTYYYVNQLVKVQVNAAQIAALVSLAYNIGLHAFEESTLLTLLNRRNYDAAAEEFLKWDHEDGIPNLGLLRRRTKEQSVFEHGA